MTYAPGTSVPAGSADPAREESLRQVSESDQEPAPLTKGQLLRLEQILSEHLDDCTARSPQIMAAVSLLSAAAIPSEMDGLFHPDVKEAWHRLDELPILAGDRNAERAVRSEDRYKPIARYMVQRLDGVDDPTPDQVAAMVAEIRRDPAAAAVRLSRGPKPEADQ